MRRTKTPSDQPPSKPEASTRPKRGEWQAPSGHTSILAATLSIDLFCRTLVHEAPDAIVYADFGGMIRFWNRGAERIFGYAASEALGRSLDIIVPDELRARHWAAYSETMRTGKTRYGAGDVLAVPARRKGGAPVWIEFTLLPFHDRDGHLLGVAAILREAIRHLDQTDTLHEEFAAPRNGEEGEISGRG